MDRGGGPASSGSKPSLFSVYQNPALSAALTSNSLRPSASTLLFILSIFSAAGLTLIFSLSRENAVATDLGLGFVSQDVARIFSKVVPALATMILLGTLLAFFRAFSQWRARNSTDVAIISLSKGTKEVTRLSKRQLGLLGLSPKLELDSEEPSKKPPKSKISSPSQSDLLVPLHPSVTGSDHLSRPSGGRSSASSGSKMHTFSTPSGSPASPSMYLVPAPSMRSPVPLQSLQSSPGTDQPVSTPWSKKRPPFHKEIATEEDLKRFLADVDEKISETISKLGTPPPTVNGFGMTSPNTMISSVNTSGATRSTPLRPVRMSPGSQKFTTPPKKGELDLPPPMSIEESIEAFEKLGVYPHIEQWRDRLRQWFSSVVLNPLLTKIETSHLKVIEAAAKLNISITLSQVGSDTPTTPTANVSQMERTNEWKPSFAVDEDGLLHQLRATLVQVLDASKLPSSNIQQAASIPVLQEAVDAIVEHQRLHALIKGEWAKGLLPQSSVRADYTVQRIRKLAEGTCVKNYEYLGNGEVYDKVNKKWSLELPSDSHLLLYLFCAFMEYPKWMLHVDPSTYTRAHGSKNPLFLGALPPKESFPEKYIAVISGVPSVLHPGACILAVGKQSPPVFALYWDKKPQFSFQATNEVMSLPFSLLVSFTARVLQYAELPFHS
ncbi:transmembrane protein [Striga asiatica]|uniref:Transmembrane protein n=1 Tax=Striga asiatica TaxID=4170 RepID=A0A5A7PQG0_STRAF|nr:transmembrane protein [Striga asiatica]